MISRPFRLQIFTHPFKALAVYPAPGQASFLSGFRNELPSTEKVNHALFFLWLSCLRLVDDLLDSASAVPLVWGTGVVVVCNARGLHDCRYWHPFLGGE